MFGYEILISFGLLAGIKAESSAYSYAIRIFVLVWTLYFLRQLFSIKLNREANVFLLCFISFWFWYFCRLTIDSWLNPGVLRVSYFEYIAQSMFICFLPALACFLINYQGKVKEIETWLFTLLLIGGLLVLWTVSVSPLEIDLETGQLQLSKLNSTSVSWMGLSLIITSLYIAFKKIKGSVGIPLFVIGFGVLVGLSLMIFGASRATAIEFIVGFGLLLLVFRRQFGLGSAIVLLILLALLGLALFEALNYGLSGVLLSRIEGGLFTDGYRTEMFNNALEMYLGAPVLGSGIEPLGWYPHNLIIEAFLVNGIFFGLLTCFLILLVMFYAFRLIMVRSDLSLLPILYILSSMSMMVSGNIYTSNLFWVLQAAVAGAYLNCRRELSAEKKQSPFS
tara:strand:+ start:5992 stop:7170 length:1179 start_codon:yes stop_codon:yes gene_type:complete